MTFFLIGYCIGLFGTLVALAKKYLQMHEAFLDLDRNYQFLEAEFHDLQITALSDHQDINRLRNEYKQDIVILSKMIEKQKPGD